MVRLPTASVLDRPRGAPAREDLGQVSDDRLLTRFLADRDETSFEALVIRHGPRVLGVCRQVLGDTQDAEDAFQATFLVLLRRADAIRKRDSLGHWLHGVAHRIAVRARARGARRRTRELEVVVEELSAVHPGDQLEGADLRPLIREEVDRLPEKYRDPVVLCYLEGLTNEEAARRLRCPPGTLKGRLTRAREILRDRLDRRGLAFALGALAVGPVAGAKAEAAGAVASIRTLRASGLAETTVEVPARLIRTTVAASALRRFGSLPASQGLSIRVAEMVEGALWDLSVRKALRTSMVAMLAVATLAVALMSIGRAAFPGSPFNAFAPAGAAAPVDGCHAEPPVPG